MATFFIFQDGSRRHLGFLKVVILMVGRVKMVNVRHRAKVRRDRSNHC